MVERIESALARRLDVLTVPRLSPDFSARVLARALALPMGDVAPAPPPPPLPRQRRAMPRRLWRAGSMGLGTLALGMISISAAAMGYFGEPIREAVVRSPVIGHVVERVMPRHLSKAAAPKLAEKPLSRPSATPSAVPAALASEAAPGGAALPGRRCWRARAAAMTPEQREAWLAAHPLAAERITRRQAWRESHSEQAAQLDERRAQRRAARSERQRRLLAPDAASEGMVPAPGMEHRDWRIERRARLRQWREHRRSLRAMPGASLPEMAEPIQP